MTLTLQPDQTGIRPSKTFFILTIPKAVAGFGCALRLNLLPIGQKGSGMTLMAIILGDSTHSTHLHFPKVRLRWVSEDSISPLALLGLQMQSEKLRSWRPHK